jgi:hypothetical protein
LYLIFLMAWGVSHQSTSKSFKDVMKEELQGLSCVTCTFLNPSSVLFCEMCGNSLNKGGRDDFLQGLEWCILNTSQSVSESESDLDENLSSVASDRSSWVSVNSEDATTTTVQQDPIQIPKSIYQDNSFVYINHSKNNRNVSGKKTNRKRNYRCDADLTFHQWEEDNAWESEKPMINVRREKHNPNGRNRGLFGHRRRRAIPWCMRNEEKNHKIEKNGDNRFHTVIDVDYDENSNTTRSLCLSMNKSKGWDKIIELLDENCVHKETKNEMNNSHKYNNMRKQKCEIYHMKPIIEEVEVAVAPKHIYYAPKKGGVPKKIFATPPLEIPSEVRGEPIKVAKFSGVSGRRMPLIRTKCSFDVMSRFIHENQTGEGTGWGISISKYKPGTQSNGKVLEVDIGRTELITELSTQGASPIVRRYPHVTYYPPGTNNIVVEGFPDWNPKERYKGPFWNVLVDDSTRNLYGTYSDPRAKLLRYVRKYEILWREDSGRQWNSLGTFNGNDDTTTEKVHSFHHLPDGGLTCRYIRIVPLDCVNGGALRLGLYGRGNDHTSRTEGGSGELVSYHITRRPEGPIPTFLCSQYRRYVDYYGRPSAKAKRLEYRLVGEKDAQDAQNSVADGHGVAYQ